MARKNPSDTVEYNRIRYLRLKAEKKRYKVDKTVKKGQRVFVGWGAISDVDLHFVDITLDQFFGKCPILRIDRHAYDIFVKQQKKKKSKNKVANPTKSKDIKRRRKNGNKN